jgi:hypothetical protein
VSDPVREYDEIFRGVERLIFSEKFTSKFRPNELRAAPSRSMSDENGIRDLALRVLVDLAESSIMNPQFGQRFAGNEFEIANGVIAFGWGRIIGGARTANGSDQREKCEKSDCRNHINGVAVRPEFVPVIRF